MAVSQPGADLTGVGVDISSEAIEYARRRYAHPSIRFIVSDALDFRDDDGFASVVSLETIEHLAKPRVFAEHVRSMLHPGGVLVASAPVTPSTDANPHHLTDFTARSFRRLFRDMELAEVGHLLQVQPYSARALVNRAEERMEGLRAGLLSYYLSHPQKLALRAVATLRHGFSNQYLTLALECTKA